VDAVISMGVLVVTAGGLGMSVLYTQKASQEMQRRDYIRAEGMRFLERLLGLPYGVTTDTAPTSSQLADLFDDNATVPTGVSLMSLRTPVNGAGWRFRVGGFETPGVWEVEVNSDLDGNGTLQGIRGTEAPTTGGSEVAGDGTTTVTMQSEGRTTLLRIEVFFNGVSVARTFRSAPVQGT
jgi:hypothetical protein